MAVVTSEEGRDWQKVDSNKRLAVAVRPSPAMTAARRCRPGPARESAWGHALGANGLSD